MLFDNDNSHSQFPSQHTSQKPYISMEISPSPSDFSLPKITPRRKTSGESDYSDFLETESNQSYKPSRLHGSSKKIVKRIPNLESQIQTPSSQKSGLRTRNSWTEAEDEQVLDLIKVHGPKWTKIALIMGGRTGKQVRDRYLNVLTPHINKTSWTQEEDKMIISMYQQFGAQWRRISEYLKGRTETQVKNRYYTNLKKRSGGIEEETEINFFESFENSEVFTAEQSPCKFMGDMFELERTKISSGYQTSRSSDSFDFTLDNSMLDFMGSGMISYKSEERGYDDSCFDF